MAPTITTVSESTVKPQRSTPPHCMFLAAGDILYRWCPYHPIALFFKPPQQPAGSSCIAQLKSSLALALVEFFPCAGRLVEEADGRLTLDCNDAGVLFVEASIDVPFSSLEADGFQHKPFFEHFTPHADVLQWSPGLPLLCVQVTRFLGDEGFVLGVGFNHVVGDGSSLWHFMKSWGECAKGLPLSMSPVHMREALRPEKLILPPTACDGANARSLAQGRRLKTPPAVSNLVQRDFHFSSEMLRKLKLMVGGQLDAGAPFSSLQVLSAHVWRHVTAARDGAESKSVFVLFANMRHRCVPALPEAYFGNALLGCPTIALTKELKEESIGRTAMRLQEVIKGMDDTSFKRCLGGMETPELEKEDEGNHFSLPWVTLSNSPRFPVYEVDFGWGPALRVRCPLIRGDGEMMWFAGAKGEGSVDFSLALTKSVMERLEQDESFLHF